MAASEPGTPPKEATETVETTASEVLVDESVAHELPGEAETVEAPPPKPRFRLHLKLPHLRFPRIRLNPALIRIVLAIVVLLVVVAALTALVWFLLLPLFFRVVLHRAPPTIAIHTPAPRPATPSPSPIPTLMPLPPEAPAVTDGLDPRVVGPFALRLAGVNKLAGKKIVTTAEYHDSDAGQRYFVAIVTSCADLNALWPIKSGKLAQIQGKFNLAEFDRFAFVERYSEGQWGVSTCDNSM